MEGWEQALRELREEISRLRGEVQAPLPTVLSKNRAARELSISRKTLDRMIKRGVLGQVPLLDGFGIPASEIRRLATPAPSPGRKTRKPASKPSPSGSSDLRAKLRKMRSP